MLFFCGLHLNSGDPNYGPLTYWLVVAALCGLSPISGSSLPRGRLVRVVDEVDELTGLIDRPDVEPGVRVNVSDGNRPEAIGVGAARR